MGIAAPQDNAECVAPTAQSTESIRYVTSSGGTMVAF
jgi:hypothetical protein